MIVVNKCDGDLQTSAQHTASDYSGSLQFIRPKYSTNLTNDCDILKPKVMLVSSKTGKNISEFVNEVYNYHNLMIKSGQIKKKRTSQAKFWMREHIKRTIISEVMNDSNVLKVFIFIFYLFEYFLILKRINECDKLLDENNMNSRSAANSIIDSINLTKT